MTLEELTTDLNKFTDLLYKKDNKRYSFYFSPIFKVWELYHTDTARVDRLDIYDYMNRFLKDTANFSMWESTHSRVKFNSGFKVQLLKAITKLQKRIDPYIQLKEGKTYELNQDLDLSTRILAKKGSIIKVNGYAPKSWGGYYLTIVPIKGKFALTSHSTFFSTAPKPVNGSRCKFYSPKELSDILGIPKYTDQITFDDWGANGRILGKEIH